MSPSQRFTLDYPSFEKLLAAAWVLQCVHDQLHGCQVDSDETIAEQVGAQKVEAGNSGLQEATKPAVQLSSTVSGAHSEREALNCRPASDETLAELAEAQQAIETGTLDLDAAIKRVVALSLRFSEAEGAAVWLFAQNDFVYRAGAGMASNNEELRVAVLSSLAGAWPHNGKLLDAANEADDSKQSWVANLGASSTSLLVAAIYQGREVAGALTVFANSPNSFADHDRTTARLMSGLLSHALRKAAEAEFRARELKAAELKTAELKTADLKPNSRPNDAVAVSHPPEPVRWKAADNNEQARRRPSFNLQTICDGTLKVFRPLRPTFHINLTLRALRAAAIKMPLLLLAMVAALLLLETWRRAPFHSAQAISAGTRFEDASKRTESTALKRLIPPLEVSHMKATDQATRSAVLELSPYEIRGLRRQAQYGDESAAFILGTAFEMGYLLRQNCTEAAHWVAIAAEAGNAAAQYNLGLRYRDGDGVIANRAESKKWLNKAAAHRSRQAELALKTLASR